MKDIELFNDHFQNFKRYNIPKAQLIIADIPYNIGKDAYGSNPTWYIGGDNTNGEDKSKAGKEFFDTDKDFRISEFLHFASQMLRKEPKNKAEGGSPCMIVFCEFEQQFELIHKAKQYGFKHYINLVFRKDFSAQVLKANMRVVGNCIDWAGRKDTTPRVHPCQKPVPLLEHLINLFTDEGDVVIDPCAGSATTLLAAGNRKRKAYGFEIKKDFFSEAKKVLNLQQEQLF